MSKLKGSVAAIKMKYLLFVFATVLFVALPTRVYQLLAIVDTENGFFMKSDITIAVLYVVVFLFVMLFMVMSFLSKEVPSPKLPTGKNPVLGITSAIMTAGLVWDLFAIEKKVVPAAGEEFVMERFMETLKNNVADNGGMLLVLQFAFAVLAVFYFIVFAISHLNGKGSYKEFKLLALSPLCWCMVSLIGNLMKAISFISVSELLFEIFMLVFAMLFFLTFARISSGVFTVDSMWGIYGYGLSACLFAGLVTIPRLATLIAGKPLVPGYEFNFAHFAIFVFIFSYVLASLGIGFKDGLAKLKTISQVALPDDDDVVIKRDATNIDDIDMWDDNEIPDLEPVIEDEIVEEIVVEEPVIEDEIIEEIVVEEPVIEDEIVEEIVVEEPVIEDEIIEEIVDEEPVIEDEIVEEIVVEEPVIEDESVEEIVAEEPVIEDEVVEEIVAEEPVFENEVFEDIVVEEPEVIDAPVVASAPVETKKKKTFSFGKKEEIEPEVIKPVSLADLRKNKE